MLAPILLLLSVAPFLAGAQAEIAKPNEVVVSNRRLADRYEVPPYSFGGGPSSRNLRGDPGRPGIGYVQIQEHQRGKFPAFPQAANRYVHSESWNFEWPPRRPKGPVRAPSTFSRVYTDRFDDEVDAEQTRRKPKGPPTPPPPFSNDYNRFESEVDIEQDRRKPKGPSPPPPFSNDYYRFESEVDIEQDRRKPKGPSPPPPFSNDYYNRFESEVDIEQDRRKTKGSPSPPPPFSNNYYNRFESEVDIEQDRRKTKGSPSPPPPFSNNYYNRFESEVDIEQDRRKTKGPPTPPPPFSNDYNRFESEVDIEQYRRKPKGPGLPSTFSNDYHRFGSEVDIEQTRRKPKGPVLPSTFSRHYNRFVVTEQERRKLEGPRVKPDYYGSNAARQQSLYPARYYDERFNEYFRTAETDPVFHPLPDKRKPYPDTLGREMQSGRPAVRPSHLNLGRENIMLRPSANSEYKPSEFMMQHQDSLED